MLLPSRKRRSRGSADYAPKSGIEEGSTNLHAFWDDVSFFGSRLEDKLARRWWPAILGIPFGAYSIYALQGGVTLKSLDPYLSSLSAALLLGALAFLYWQSTVRETFGRAADYGIISATPSSTEDFLRRSLELSGRMRSAYRFIFIAVAIGVTLYGNRYLRSGLIHGDLPLLDTLIILILILYSYAVGAVAWSLLATAMWIASVSRTKVLNIQVGHSDGCCGLEPIGNCCLQSAIPLLIGMVLCAIWSYSHRLSIFTGQERWFPTIEPLSRFGVVLLFVLACALVFLPVRGLHKQMEEFKREHDVRYANAVAIELSYITKALDSDDAERVKATADRVKLLQAMDPTSLKLGTWPFDRVSLTKYALAPLGSLLASFGKDLFTTIARQ